MPRAHALLQPVDLCLPNLPPRLESKRIVHLSDLHVRRSRGRHHGLASHLTRQPLDLLLLTGDYMEEIGHEAYALDTLGEMLQPLRPSIGTFGVFGNHDSAAFREQARDLPVHWLINDALDLPEYDLELWGFDTHPDHEGADSIALLTRRRLRRASQAAPSGAAGAEEASDESQDEGETRPFRLLLAHSPSHLPVAADLHADLMLSGHTHGGQCRLPTGHALTNACDMPLHLIAGLLRHRHTLAAVSRGIGHSSRIPRAFCPPHVPLYTLRRGPMPGSFTQRIDNLQPW